MTRKEKLIYMAGIVDGEGCFYRGNPKNGRGVRYWQSSLHVENKSTELKDFMIENFGGYAWLNIRRKEHPKWHDLWRWIIRGKAAEALAIELRPYLIVKQEQVKRILPTEKEYIRPYTK